MDSRLGLGAVALGALLLLALGRCGGHVPETARRGRTVYVLQQATMLLAIQSDRTGRYPSPGRKLSLLGPIIADLDPKSHDPDDQLDGWGNQPYYWTNGLNLAVISAGRDGELDLDYETLLRTGNLEAASDFCGQLTGACKDDMVLLDGKSCVDFSPIGRARAQK